jgi:hypothetical protein
MGERRDTNHRASDRARAELSELVSRSHTRAYRSFWFDKGLEEFQRLSFNVLRLETETVNRKTYIIHLKLQEEMESHMAFHLGRNLTTVAITQEQDTIEKRSRLKTY